MRGAWRRPTVRRESPVVCRLMDRGRDRASFRSGSGVIVALATLLLCACGARSPVIAPDALAADAGNSEDAGSDDQGQAMDAPEGEIDWDAQGGPIITAGTSCEMTEDLSGWVVQGSYPDNGIAYDGPAQYRGVGELTLTDAPGADSGAPPYVYLSSVAGVFLPGGANVWVTLTFEGEPASNPCGAYPYPPDSCPVAVGWSFVVRDHQQGTILFGQTKEDPNERLGPINPSRAFPYCSSACRTYYGVDIPGADHNPISDGGHATVLIAGVAYGITVLANSDFVGLPECTEPAPGKLVTIVFQAKDLAQRAAALAPP